MREFKLSRRYFATGFFAIIIALVIGAILRSGLAIAIRAVLVLIEIYDLLKKAFLTYIIDEKCLIKRTLTKRKIMFYWKEVRTVARLAYVKNSVGIFGGNKKFIINAMIKDYKVMIKLISEKCINNPDINIDPKVFDQ